MATLKEVQACLYDNPHLTEEVKECFSKAL